MGVFKAISGSMSGTAADQWLEVYACDSLPEDVLAQRAFHKSGERSANTKGDPDVVTDGSTVIVNSGQCAMLIDRGEVVDCCSQPGTYAFHSKRSGSLFSGGGLKSVFKQSVDRFGYGGIAAVHQVVIFLDIREHMANPFYLSRAVNIRDRNTNMRFDAQLQLGGLYSFRITDPPVFYKKVCGNSTGTVRKSDVIKQLTAELEMQLSVAISRILTVEGATPTELSAGMDIVIKKAVEALNAEWSQLRGLSVVSLAADAVALIPKDLNMLQSVQWAKVLTDPSTAAAALVGARAQALQDAAKNTGKIKVTWNR